MSLRAGAFLASALALFAAAPCTGAPLFEAPFLSFHVGRSPTAIATADLDADGHPDLVVPAYNSNAVSVLLGNGDRTFGARTDFTTAKNPQSVAIGDLNGDTRPDLVVADYGAAAVSVLLGNGDGTFQAKVDYAAGANPQHLVLADLDHDGDLDVVVTSRSTNTVGVLRGNGDGTLGARTGFATGATPLWVAVGLVNGDAHPDLVVANYGANTVSVLAGYGNGSFAARSDHSSGPAPRGLALADLDHDGDLDLAVANASAATVSVLAGAGNGSFGLPMAQAVGAGPQAVTIADLDHDGEPDVASANSSGNSVSLLKGRGDLTFAPRTDHRAGNQPNGLVVTDVDSDGAADVAVSCAFTWDFAEIALLPGNGDGTFGTQRHTATGTDPWSVTCGDLDRDGRPDAVTSNYSAHTISVLLGRGDGSFLPRVDHAVGLNPVSVALADLDRDGRLDVAVANRGSGTVSVMMGGGDGTLGTRRDHAVGSTPMAVAAGDLDGDGWPDLAVVNRGSSTVSVLRGNGDGTFAAKVDFATGADPFGVAVGDLDADSVPDLAVANSSSNSVSVLRGRGDGTFAPRVDHPTGAQPYSVAIADLDGDGDADLAVADRGSNAVSVLPGRGDGTFAARTDHGAGLFPQSVAVADVDRDGHPDLAVANEQSNGVSVLLGQGGGAFAPQAGYGAGTYARALAVADLDEDHGDDLLVVCYSLNSVTVLRNGSAPPTAEPVTLEAASGPITWADSCVSVPVTIRRTSTVPLRGFSATVRLSRNLRLCGAGAEEGGYLSSAGPNVRLQVVERANDEYAVDAVLLGAPCGADAEEGTLFTLYVASDSSGTGSVTLAQVVLRDCSNAPLPGHVAAPGVTTIPILQGPNPVALGVPSGCITNVDTCVTLPVTIARSNGVPARGFSVTVQLSPGLRLGGPRATEGGYLGDVNPEDVFKVTDRGGGLYTVDGIILGQPCGATAPAGALVLLHLASEAAGGTGTVTLTGVLLRDCDNLPMDVSLVADPATVTIQNVRPDAVEGLLATVLPDDPGEATRRISVAWAAPDSGLTVELYRAAYGAYPEYDDAGGSAPTAPAWPPDPRWVHLASLPSGTAFEDDPGVRDVFTYAAFARDACGNVSAPVLTAGTLDYRLGDVSDGIVQCQGDARVWTDDLSLLGSRYGATLPDGDPLGCLDVGPTSDGTAAGRPLTDGVLDFEDLMMFSTGFDAPPEPPSAPAPAPRDEVTVSAPARVAAGEVFTATLGMRGAGDLQGLSARLAWDPAVAVPLDVAPGALVGPQGGVVLSGRPGVVDVALLGARARGLAGDGTLATVRFRALASGEPRVAVAAVDARDGRNRRVTLGGAPAPPAETSLLPVRPNPVQGAVTLDFSLARGGPVELAIFSVDGRRVRDLVRGELAPGVHRPVWPGTDDAGRHVRPGLYYVRLVTAQGTFTRAFVVLR